MLGPKCDPGHADGLSDVLVGVLCLYLYTLRRVFYNNWVRLSVIAITTRLLN